MGVELALADVVLEYKRHGWIPQRLLFAHPQRFSDADIAAAQLADIEVRDAAIDAIWFTRRSAEDRVAWELRRLTGTPFALVVVLPDETPDADRETLLSATEDRMLETSQRFTGQNGGEK